jgi:hypothetical protein
MGNQVSTLRALVSAFGIVMDTYSSEILGRAAGCALIQILLVTVLSYFSYRWKFRTRGFMWGMWGISVLIVMVASLPLIMESIGLINGAMRPSLTGLEVLAGIQILFVIAIVLAVVLFSFFLLKRWLAVSSPGFILLGASAGALVMLTVAIVKQHSTRDAWTVFVCDQNGKPVESAHVSWKLFGYGPGGTRPAEPIDSSQDSLTDTKGCVTVFGREGLYEMVGQVQKADYEAVNFTVGMAFENLPSRDVTFERERLRYFSGYPDQQTAGLSKTGRLSFVVFLPHNSEFDQPVEVRRLAWQAATNEAGAPVLTLCTSPLGTPIRVRVWLSAPSNDYSYPGLAVEGLDGTGIYLVPKDPPVGVQDARYSDIFPSAPETGYQSKQEVSASNDFFIFYAKAVDGSGYARLDIYGIEDARFKIFSRRTTNIQEEVQLGGVVFWNTAGGRCLFHERPPPLPASH